MTPGIPRRKRIVLVFMLLALMSVACLFGGGEEEALFNPAATMEVLPTLTDLPVEQSTVLPTETPWPLVHWTVVEAMEAAAFLREASDEEIVNYLAAMGEEQKAGLDELLDYLPDAGLAERVRTLAEIEFSEAQVEALEPWRMPPLDGAVLVVNDLMADPQWDETIAMHAANLAVPAPYFYEVYALPEGTRYADVRPHYVEFMERMGYRTTRDEQGLNDIYLLTFMSNESKQSRNAILFYTSPPAVIVLYSNPLS